METIIQDAHKIIHDVLQAANPDTLVKNALQGISFDNGKVIVICIGKAAYTMAQATKEVLGKRIDQGICISKYAHIKGEIPGFACYEAGHPITDEQGVQATQKVLQLVQRLQKEDTVLICISGGGSALFESPMIPLDQYNQIVEQLLKSGADIHEMNTVRKHLSNVKGGRFAQLCEPAHVKGILLSDVLGDDVDVIASGPISADTSTSEQALEILQKYQILYDDNVRLVLEKETPKRIDNSDVQVIGSVRILCYEAQKICTQLGYQAIVKQTDLCCEACCAAKQFGQEAKTVHGKVAIIRGGETVVHVVGKGLGGRNQEMALACANEIANMKNVCFFSVGSDGTDGPTDAAGGIVTGHTKAELTSIGISIEDVLADNDAYHALKKCGGLIQTGPTGTNLNDFSVLLIEKG